MKSLNILLIGFGRMGHEIKQVAEERQHNVFLTIDNDNQDDFSPENLKKADVAIEFSVPDAAYDNIMKCMKNNVPVVSGTTGWLDKFYDIRKYCLENESSFFYASNFSIGVNLLFNVNRHLAKMMDQYSNYQVSIEETHHKHKLDAPSGTAVTIAESIIEEMNRINEWKEESTDSEEAIPVKSIRKNEIPGIHKVTYESEFDTIEIKHSAKSRKGFALGAIVAAEYIYNKSGMFSMDDLLNT